MTEKKEMLLIEKTQWESLVSKVRDLIQQVSILKESMSQSLNTTRTKNYGYCLE